MGNSSDEEHSSYEKMHIVMLYKSILLYRKKIMCMLKHRKSNT
jgi:hypothetical protein